MSKEEYEDRVEALMDIGYSRWDAILSIEGELAWERDLQLTDLH